MQIYKYGLCFVAVQGKRPGSSLHYTKEDEEKGKMRFRNAPGEQVSENSNLFKIPSTENVNHHYETTKDNSFYHWIESHFTNSDKSENESLNYSPFGDLEPAYISEKSEKNCCFQFLSLIVSFFEKMFGTKKSDTPSIMGYRESLADPLLSP